MISTSIVIGRYELENDKIKHLICIIALTFVTSDNNFADRCKKCLLSIDSNISCHDHLDNLMNISLKVSLLFSVGGCGADKSLVGRLGNPRPKNPNI